MDGIYVCYPLCGDIAVIYYCAAVQNGESTLLVEGITRIQVSNPQESQDEKLYSVAVKLPTPVTKSNLSKILRKDINSQEDVLGAQLLAR